jgi:hypothetical protein
MTHVSTNTGVPDRIADRVRPGWRAVSWSSFVVWSVAGGIGLGIARLVSNRAATVGWRIATGSAPPKVGADQVPP